MGVSNHYLASSSPIRPSLIPKNSSSDAGETNENDQNSHKKGSNSQNQKKTTTKNFMSPTISAASKSVVPRRNILAEMNESSDSVFSETPVQKTPNFYSKSSPQFDNEEPEKIVSNPSSKHYDPLTNYLSPRPKFLLYNPNRHREIYLRHENESKETEDDNDVVRSGSFDSKIFIVDETPTSFSDSYEEEEGSVYEEEEEEEEVEENEDEFEEEGWNLNEPWKTLFVLGVLVLSMLYISSMNSSTPPPALQAIRNFKNELWEIQNPLFGSVSLNHFGEENDFFLDKYEVTEVNDNGHELVEILEKHGGGSNVIEISEINQVLEQKIEDSEDVCDDNAEIKMEVSNLMSKSNGLEERETQEKMESCDLAYHQDKVLNHVIAFETDENADGEDFSYKIEENQAIVEELSKEGYQNEEVAENEAQLIHDLELKSMESGIEQIKTSSMVNLAIGGVSAIIALIASLVFVFHFKRERTSPPSLAINSLITEEGIEAQEHVKTEKVDTAAPSFSLNHSKVENSREFYESRAPTVELLGEFEVGEFSTSSIMKSCRKKSRMEESDLSNYSISQKENSWSKAISSEPREYVSEFSSMDSPSYGSFTAEKKIIKKEGRDREIRRVITTTPVRRSSRLNKGAVISPCS